ncbi:MAG: XdhC family protein [Cyclobacteriaceae bacterium]|nr:XdhC family protein [Cyclobacteriaceae bacterium]
MKFWTTIKEELEAGYSLALMYVLKSKGSSPGRQGFKMLVSQSGLLAGSIGGGVMEHKLVELCKTELLTTPFKPFVKKQIHQPNVSVHKSGLICSGQQTIAFYHLGKDQLLLIQKIIKANNSKNVQLVLSNSGIQLIEADNILKFQLEITNNQHWKLKEQLNFLPQLYIIGGGHVSLALSKFAKETGFNVIVYDDRSRLNTIEQNNFAKTVYLKKYSSIKENVPDGVQTYVVIMSFGFKTDKVILKSLLKGNYKYLGIMGSQAKIDALLKELIEEGTANKELEKVFAPIGLPMASKTPQEIAVSILGQLIQVKNES